MRSKLFYIVPTVLLFTQILFAQQVDYYAGGGLGFGNIKGNSPAQTSLSGTVIFGIDNIFDSKVGMRTAFSYARKVNYFLPENSAGKYYPYITSISLKAVIEQNLNGKLFTEQAMGFVGLNDRTFSDVNQWDYGITFSAMLGWDLRDFTQQGFKIGFAGDVALTFTSTTASYYLIYFQALYYF